MGKSNFTFPDSDFSFESESPQQIAKNWRKAMKGIHDRKSGSSFLKSRSDCQKSLAEFAASAAKRILIIFCRGAYLAENTSQAASVEFVRLWRTNYARGRLQKLAEKPEGVFRQVQSSAMESMAEDAYGVQSSLTRSTVMEDAVLCAVKITYPLATTPVISRTAPSSSTVTV